MIRLAKKEDSSQIYQLLKYIFIDMELPLLERLGNQQSEQFFCELIEQEHTRFSYRNMLVYEVEGQLAGLVNGYPAVNEDAYDEQMIKLFPKYHLEDYPKQFAGKEGWGNEWYLDSLVVDKHFRGQGIGQALLLAVPEFISINTQCTTIGLNCEKDNLGAKKLYENFGFTVVGNHTILNHQYYHMQKALQNS